MTSPGPRNSMTDLSGIHVGHATDERAASGVTVIRFEQAMTAAVDVRGGGPGTRETDVLAPENLVDKADALVLSGGSVFGLAAADAVAAALSHQGVGLRMSNRGPGVPIVPAAVLYDLDNNGTKDWGEVPPYRHLGQEALNATGRDFALGSVGAGRGANAGTEKGGVGSASINLGDGVIVAALAVVNSLGTVRMADGESFYAWPYELNAEFGGQPPPAHQDLSEPIPSMCRLGADGHLKAGANTTLAVVATSLDISATELKRIALAAHDGMARAIRPVHTLFDGDIVFAVSTGACSPGKDDLQRMTQITQVGSAAADTLARAIARGVYTAQPSNNQRF